jgi:lysophospholipase L1-like esterase
MQPIWTSELEIAGPTDAPPGRHDVEPISSADANPALESGLLWRVGSSLKTAEIVLRDVVWSGGGDGAVAIWIGRPNEWAANGVLRLDLSRRRGVATAKLLWDDGRATTLLRQCSLLERPGATESPARFGEITLAIDERPPSAWRWSFGNLGSARGMAATELGYRPYAVTAQEVVVAAGGAARIGAWGGRVGARPAPVVAFGDSQLHAGRVLEQLARRGLPPHTNAGQAGGDTTGGLARLRSDLLALRPTHALFWLGSNDFGYARARGEEPGGAMEATLTHLGDLMREAWDAAITPVMIGALPRGGEPIIREFNSRLGTLAGRMGAAFFDPYEVLHRRHDKQDIRLSDGLHPNDAGASKLADWFAEAGLIEALGGLRRPA